MKRVILSTLVLLCCSGCVTDVLEDPVAKNPDHRIVIAPATAGSRVMKAYPPECPAWSEHRPDPNDNLPQPQIGCASQRNLALMIEEPTDLIAGRALGAAAAEKSAAAVQRYHDNKVSGLYDPATPPIAKE